MLGFVFVHFDFLTHPWAVDVEAQIACGCFRSGDLDPRGYVKTVSILGEFVQR